MLYLVLASWIMLAAYVMTVRDKQLVERSAVGELDTVARSVQEKVETWRRERLNDARATQANTLIMRHAAAYLRLPARGGNEADMRAWLESVHVMDDYCCSLLLDTNGTVLLASPCDVQSVHGEYGSSIAEALRTRTPILSDCSPAGSAGMPHFDILVPVVDGSNAPAGVLAERIDAGTVLNPLVREWPRQSRSAETLLVARDGDEVFYVAGPAGRDGGALRLPVTNEQLVSAMVLRGAEGTVRGCDYRGVPVLAAARRVADSPWNVISKIDREEAMAPFRTHVFWTAALVAGLMGVAAVVFAYVGQRQKAAFFRSRLEERRARLALVRRNNAERRTAAGKISLLATAIDQAAEAIVITDAHRRIEYVNNAFEHITGYTRDEAVGNTPHMIQSGAHDDAFYETMHATLGAGGSWSGYLTNRRKDGTLFQVEATITPVKDGEGRTVNYVAVEHDVTHDNALREHLMRSQKLETVGRLAGGIAADFHNLLQVITWSSEALLLELPEDDGKRADALAIQEAAHRAGAMSRHLLAFSHSHAYELRRMHLNELVMRMEPMVRRIIGDGISLEMDLEPALWPVKADQGQIEEIIMNLVTNAREAMPGGGVITISTANAEFRNAGGHRIVEPAREGSFVCLAVLDTGVGIAPDVQEHIFEPFFSTKGAGYGAGLGLAACYGIATKHGGWITGESEPGAGAAFRVYMPADLEANGAAAENDGPSAREEFVGDGQTILLVEDDPGTSNLTRRVLGTHGYSVLRAGTVREALRLFDEHQGRADMLIADLLLSDGNGLNLATHLAARKNALPVLLVTGYAEDRASWDVIRERGYRIIQKPYRVTALLRAVKELLSNGHAHAGMAVSAVGASHA